MDRSAEDIIAIVEQHHLSTGNKRNLMMEDHRKFWALEKYTRPKENTGGRVYTSSRPRSYAEKVLSTLSAAKLVIKTIQDDSVATERDVNNSRERVAIGMLRAVDERRKNQQLPPLKKSVPFPATARGFIPGVWLIRKVDDGNGGDTSYPDVSLYDPINTYWEDGPDGLQSVVFKLSLTREQIKAKFPDARAPGLEEDDPKEEFDVFDYWDDEHNKIVTEAETLKGATVHGSPRNPAVIVPVGAMSKEFWQAGEIDQWGESIWAGARGVYEETNFQLSVVSDRASKADKPSRVWYTEEGTAVPDEDPNDTGDDIPMRTTERVENLPAPEIVQEQGAFLNLLAQEEQRATIPAPAYGETGGQPISGFLATILNQGADSAFGPPLDAMISFYELGINLLLDQYATGSFGEMTFSGQDLAPRRQYFRQAITPDSIGNGVIEVDFIAQLPQDDATNVATAAALIQNGIADMRYVREKVMRIQDPDLMQDSIMEERAAVSHPLAMAFSLMDAAAKRGENELAQVYLAEAQKAMLQEQLHMMQLQMLASGLSGAGSSGGQNGGGGQGTPPSPGLLPNNVLPFQMQGVPQPNTTNFGGRPATNGAGNFFSGAPV